MSTAGDFPAAEPHGPFQEIADGVWFVGGRIRMNRGMTISRNMTVVRTGTDLTLINPIRLTPTGESELESLGTVRHMMRLGAWHGIDDPYTKSRFDATFWCQANSNHYRDPPPDEIIDAAAMLPIPDAELFVFEGAVRPECALVIRRGPGVLCTCDAIQHYGTYERQSLLAKLTMPLLGFKRGAVIGPFWLKFQTPEGGSLRAEFERLASLQFDIILSAHGTPLLAGGPQAVRRAIERAFPDSS